MASPPLRGRRVALRALDLDDADRLTAILAEPSVARWWPAHGAARVRDELIGGEPDVTVWGIERDGRLVGLIQAWEESEPQFRHANIDLFLAPEAQGEGLGPDAVRTVARFLIDERGHHRLTIDPEVENDRAVRAYARVGFRPVGVMRAYARGPDGAWHDGLLMDLLASELIDEPAG